MPSKKIESSNKDIITIAKKLQTPKEIYNFVIKTVKYNLNSKYRNQGAYSALTNKEGVCEDQASLFVTLCRANGIPARVVNGFASSDCDLWDSNCNLDLNRHTWAEYYLDNKWIPIDCTFRTFGYIDNSHIPQNYLDTNLNVSAIGIKNLSITWQNFYLTN